ncbi:hypothetical protein BDZ94DRAFT_1167897, partial [Collybia nuda]
RDFLFLLMSISFGGLGLMSLRNPFAGLVGMVLGKTDLRSMFCLVVFFIVVFVLAYLTNPSENSFRAYLTEQSFRQHLSRLDDNTDDNHTTPNTTNSTNAVRRSTLATVHTLSFDNSSPFHFANRASVSLRTPKHVFHSFGIFTIAAMVPLARSARRDERDGLMISDSWYIGAFGRWWRGGIIEAWYQDVVTRSKDEESWSSGILSMKNLDMLNEYSGLPFSTKGLPSRLLARGSPPKLRNRERSSQRPVILPTRSSTPPPLPKSASLPLHTARTPSLSAVDRPSAQPLLHTHSQSCHAPEQGRLSSTPSRSPSTLFDQSPRIAELLRQITLSKTLVLDLRAQLTDCQQSASHSHSLLQSEVDSFRERKRKEDVIKLELKSRTKALDDAKRMAESTKKDAEKKLKAAQNARDNATQRIDHLDKEISQLQQRLAEDGALIHRPKDMLSEAEQDIVDALEHKKLEIKVAEDVVTALNQRARDLEERLSEEKERLVRLKERNEIRRQERSLSQIDNHPASSSPWPSVVHHPQDCADVSSALESKERQQGLTGFEVMSGLGRRPSITRDTRSSSRPNTLTLGTLSNFNSHPGTVYSAVNATQAALRANGYSVFDDGMVSVSHHHTSNFSPFGDSEISQPRSVPGVGSPTSQSLIPSNLITPVGNVDSVSRSFQSDSDVYMEKDWRGFNTAPYMQQTVHRSNNFPSGFDTVTTSPVSLHDSSVHDYELDPFEVRFMSSRDYRHEQQTRHHMTADDSMDSQRSSWLHRTNSDPNPNQHIVDFNQSNNSTVMEKASPRRWFSTMSKERPKRGLNPDAKVFNLARKTPPRKFAPGPGLNGSVHTIKASNYDALNPNGLGPTAMPAPASANNSLLRAFAPSPAEREALQRALGGSTNTSFERLPSLSDVGSIPSSPSHVHARPVLPSWLQSLPRIRKPNFSPWDDEEPSSINVIGHNEGSVRRR